MVHVHFFKIDAEIQSVIHLRCSFATNWKASSENQKSFSGSFLPKSTGFAKLPKKCSVACRSSKGLFGPFIAVF